MKRYLFLITSLYFLLNCGDLRIEWLNEFCPAGKGDYEIIDIAGFLEKYYITGSYTLNSTTSAIFAEYNGRGKTRWIKLYENKNLLSSQGRKILITKEYSLNDELVIYQLIDGIDEDGNYHLLLLRYDSLGRITGEKEVKKSVNKIAADLMMDEQNNLFIVGQESTDKIFINKYLPSGEEIFKKEYPLQTPINDCKSLITKNREIILAGIEQKNKNVCYIKFDDSGEFKKLIEYQNEKEETTLCDFKTDHLGNVYLTGITHGENSTLDWLILVYDSKDSLLWLKEHNRAQCDDIPFGTVIDDSLNLFVAGYCVDQSGKKEIALIKYNKNGEILKEEITKISDDSAPPLFFNSDILEHAKKRMVNHLYITALADNKIILIRYNHDGRFVRCYRFLLNKKRYRAIAQEGPILVLANIEGKKTVNYLSKFGRFEILGISRWD
uniref:Uncharacterized protein n=1 Tax=candidate division WOR-3 bacterium TaxID=2052148 RepID=A0A7C4XFU5_UNCW3